MKLKLFALCLIPLLLNACTPKPLSQQSLPQPSSQGESPHQVLFQQAYQASIQDNFPKSREAIIEEMLQLLREQGDARYAQALQDFGKQHGAQHLAQAANILLRQDLSAYPLTEFEVLRAPKI